MTPGPMTREQIKSRFPNASESFIRKNCAGGLRAGDAESTQGNALVRCSSREDKGCACVAIRFVVYSRRPADWDGYSIKECQDMLVHAGILDVDSWDALSGAVVSRKVHSEKEERTEIEILANG